MSDVKRSWDRIEAWLGRKAKRIRKTLAAGASAEQVKAFEREQELRLPGDVVESYRLHEESDLFPSSAYDDMGYSLMSLAEIAAERKRMSTLQNRYLPLAGNGAGDVQCIDLKTGKVVELNHETGERKVLADSWARRLTDLAAGLESGRFAYDRECGIVAVEPAPPPGQFRSIQMARECLAQGAKRETYQIKPPALEAPYRPVLLAIKRLKLPMRIMPFSRMQAAARLNIGRNDVPKFLENFEPSREFEHKGLRFYPLERLIELNEPHYCEYPKQFPVVIATTSANDRICMDMVLNEEEPPVVLYPAAFSLKGKNRKALEPHAKVLARNLLEFMKLLTSKGALPLAE